MNERCKTTILLAMAFMALSSAALADGSRLAAGDVIAVSVEGEKDLSKNYQLDQGQEIVMPMIGSVELGGLNTTAAAQAIANALTKVLVDPQVTVAFVERAKMQVFVVGRVKTPGPIMVGVGDRVLQAVAQAGYDDTADLSAVSVRRGTSSVDVDLNKYLEGADLSVNVELQAGDTIVVPAADLVGSVMVNGEVMKVGRIPLKQGMTFRDGLGLAGGVTPDADTETVTITRDGTTEPLKINYKQAMSGDPASNVVLHVGDTIYVRQLDKSFFTIMGAVNKPGQYPLKGSLSLTEAIGLAGGTMPKVTDMKRVTITRAPQNGLQGPSVTANLDNILRKNAEDPQIHRGDVIFVRDRKEKPTPLQLFESIIPLAWLLRR